MRKAKIQVFINQNYTFIPSSHVTKTDFVLKNKIFSALLCEKSMFVFV